MNERELRRKGDSPSARFHRAKDQIFAKWGMADVVRISSHDHMFFKDVLMPRYMELRRLMNFAVEETAEADLERAITLMHEILTLGTERLARGDVPPWPRTAT